MWYAKVRSDIGLLQPLSFINLDTLNYSTQNLRKSPELSANIIEDSSNSTGIISLSKDGGPDHFYIYLKHVSL